MTRGPDSGLNRHVRSLEQCYVATATKRAIEPAPPELRIPPAQARACAGAVASRYLAVGTPRSIGIISGDDPDEAIASLVAHHTWFFPIPDVRWAGNSATQLAVAVGKAVDLDAALAADIVCIHTSMTLAAAQLRRGTHVNALAPVELDAELRRLATITEEPTGLPALAAGLVDGRQLDELTVFVAGEAAIARTHLAP
jgi:hypothetical protein